MSASSAQQIECDTGSVKLPFSFVKGMGVCYNPAHAASPHNKGLAHPPEYRQIGMTTTNPQVQAPTTPSYDDPAHFRGVLSVIGGEDDTVRRHSPQTRASMNPAEQDLKQASQIEFKALFISGADGGTRRYRCFHAQEQLELYGIPTGFRAFDDFLLFQDVLEYDIFVFHRVPYTRLVGDILELIHQRGKIAIFETDDLIFEPEMVQYDGLYRSLHPDNARQYMHKVHRHLKTLERCDYALTTTDYLADMLRRRGKQTFTNRNALGSEFVRLAKEAGRPSVKEADDRLVIGYISGSTSHDHDFEVISDVLGHVMNKHPRVGLRIVGPLNLGKRLVRFHRRIQLIPFIRWQDVPREIRAMDINLAPLEQDNPFCQSKSELKYFEAGILGVPVVASRTDAFEFAIRHGETGFLAGNTDEWIACLELLITDPARRRAVGEAAYHDVLQNYTPQARGRQFSQVLCDLVTQHQPDPNVVSEPGQVDRRVIARLSEILAELTAPSDPLIERLNEALVVVRRERRRPLARLTAWAKYLVKKLTHQVYRSERGGETYQLMDELTGGQIYGQTFQATAPDLCRVAVLFATFGRVNTPEVVFRLKESPTSEVDLVTHTVSASLFRDSDFHLFAFDSFPDSAGRHYYFSIESPDAVRGDALGLWTRLGPADAAGTMYKNGQPISSQLAYVVQYE